MVFSRNIIIAQIITVPQRLKCGCGFVGPLRCNSLTTQKINIDIAAARTSDPAPGLRLSRALFRNRCAANFYKKFYIRTL
jgi:hypothetical protein